MALKRLLASFLADLISKSYYFTQLARLIVQAYDNDCNPEMYRNGEVKLINLIQSRRGDDSIFVDVGANKGDWSEAVVKCGGGQLILVDPLKRNLEMGSRKLTSLKFNNFQLCEYAISDKKEKMKFFVNKDQRHSGTDSLHDMRKIGYNDDLDCVEVQSITLDELAAQLGVARIRFLKIDIEGHELFALRGAKSLLSTGAIDFIQIEFGHAARAAGVYLHDIVHFINEYNYNIFVIKPSGLLPLDFSPFTENRYSYINFLLARYDVCDELKVHLLKR